jgi:hypothetical protein
LANDFEAVGLALTANSGAIAAVRTVTEKLDTTMEADVGGASKFTAAALEEAPTADLLRVLGLAGENQFIDNVVLDVAERMTSARLRTYSVAASTGTDEDVLATYAITASYTGTETTSATYAMERVENGS